MSTQPDTALQPWHAHRFAYFRGASDSNITTGEDYKTQTLAALWALEPGDKAKMNGLAMIPSSYCDYDARSHGPQRERGSFIALTGDVDGGNFDASAIGEAVEAFAPGSARLIYTSAHSRPGDQRWRIILPLEAPVPFDTWHDAQIAFFRFMEARGIAMDHALARAGQPVYLPNVPPAHKSGTPLRGDDGKPLYYERHATALDTPGLSLATGNVADGIAAIRRQRLLDEQERERMRREAERQRANKPQGDGASLIDDFNASNSVADMLAMCGYEQCPRNGDDWKSPQQTSESYATRVMGAKWFSLSATDAASGLGTSHPSGCWGDAFDLFCFWQHGNDRKAALRQLGRERRDSNVTYPAAFHAEPPSWMNDIPTYDEQPDWASDEGDPVFEAVEPQQEATVKTLPFEWAGQTAPVLDGLWLIEDWLPKSGIAAVYGHPGCGKSFLVLDMAAHVAAGQAWAGRHTEQGLVVYVVAEGQTGFRNRLYAMQREGKIAPDAPFVFIPTPIDLQAPDGDLAALMDTIRAVADQAGVPLAMLVIDTLSKTFGAGKENTDDMAGYVANCQRVSSAFDCVTVVVHHRPKDSESRDLRGHSSLRGGIETMILVEAGEIKTATTLKQKDGEDNVVVRFKLERVVIGEDKRGKEISTCLTSIVDGAVPTEQMDPTERRKAKLSGHKKTALKAIEEVIAKCGVEPCADIPADSINRFKTWKAAHAGVVSDRLKNEFHALEDGDEDKRRDNARRNANRALKDLKSAGIIGTWGDWIWVN